MIGSKKLATGWSEEEITHAAHYLNVAHYGFPSH